jgi:hypothetical protein
MFDVKMKLPTFEISPSSHGEFIRFWANLYTDKHEEHYSHNIGKKLTPESVKELFLWKNSGNPSDLKNKSIEGNFVAKLEEVNNLPKETTPEEFLKKFSRGGAIWRIFFLHIWQPEKYPIYDQHVHRAMMFLRDGKRMEIPTKTQEKIATYLSDYIPFHGQFQDDGNRSVDKALWTFGKFLKSSFGKILST